MVADTWVGGGLGGRGCERDWRAEGTWYGFQPEQGTACAAGLEGGG